MPDNFTQLSEEGYTITVVTACQLKNTPDNTQQEKLQTLTSPCFLMLDL